MNEERVDLMEADAPGTVAGMAATGMRTTRRRGRNAEDAPDATVVRPRTRMRADAQAFATPAPSRAGPSAAPAAAAIVPGTASRLPQMGEVVYSAQGAGFDLPSRVPIAAALWCWTPLPSPPSPQGPRSASTRAAPSSRLHRERSSHRPSPGAPGRRSTSSSPPLRRRARVTAKAAAARAAATRAEPQTKRGWCVMYIHRSRGHGRAPSGPGWRRGGTECRRRWRRARKGRRRR